MKFEANNLEKEMNSAEAVKFYCYLNNISYKPATTEENRIKGIDFYIDNIPTDAKATTNIYLGNYSDKFLLRHPFKQNSEAKNYFISKITKTNNITESKMIFEPIDKYLSRKYLNKPSDFNHLKHILNRFNMMTFKDNMCKSIPHFMMTLKYDIRAAKILKDNADIKYFENEEVTTLTLSLK